MSDAVISHPGVSVFFTVTLDVVDLGVWSKISGLGMEIKTTPRTEFGMTLFQHNLPAHLSYGNITLSRPASADASTVMHWLSSYHMLPIPSAGQISAVDQTGMVVMSWEMFGVTPVSWKGPDLDAAAPAQVAMEHMTLAHMGFM
jgi:phage tail-like protein